MARPQVKPYGIFKAIFAEGQTDLAHRLGLTQSVVSNWLSRGRIPAERVLDVERETGVSRYAMRPDIFGRRPLVNGKSRKTKDKRPAGR